MSRLRSDPEWYEALRSSYEGFVEDDDPFSSVATERIVYDFVTPEHISPRAAVLDPDGLEAAVDRQGYFGWNVPGWEERLRKSEL